MMHILGLTNFKSVKVRCLSQATTVTCTLISSHLICIDLVPTIKQEKFLKGKTTKNELSGFLKMVVSVFKTSFKNQKPELNKSHIESINILIKKNSKKVS